jgi:hypothetical protein
VRLDTRGKRHHCNDSRAEFSLFWRSVNGFGFGDLAQILQRENARSTTADRPRIGGGD